MPRIPLYNQGQGLTTRMATGALSPRANVGAFTVPGQAQARLASQAGQIAFDFGMAQKNAETRREQDEYFTQFSREFAEYNRKDKQTDTTKYRDDFKKFSDEKLKTIDARTDLTNSQKNKIKQSLSSTILSYSNSGENKAFNRGQIIRTEKAVSSISEKINQASLVPKGHADRVRLLTEIEKDLSAYNLDGLRTGYSIQSIKKGFEALDFGKQIDAATSASQLNEIALEVSKSTLNASTQQKTKNRIKTRKSEIRAKAYDDNVGIVNSLSVNFEDKEPLEDAILKGEVQSFTTDEGQTVVVDTSELSNTQRSNLVRSYVNPLFKDLEDLATQNIANSLAESDNPFQASLDLFKDENRAGLPQTDEQLEGTILSVAQDISESVEAAVTSGDISSVQNLAENISMARDMINHDYRGQGSLLQRQGTMGNTANSIQQKLARAEKELYKAVNNQNLIKGGQLAMSQNNLIAYANAAGLTDKQQNKVVESTMQSLAGKSLFNDAQINALARNNQTYDLFKETLSLGAANLRNPDVDVATDPYVQSAYELYKRMDLREQLKLNHTNSEVRRVFDSMQVLEKSLGFEGAVNVIRMQRDMSDSDLNIRYKEVQKKVEEVIDDKSLTYSWMDYIPFMGKDAEFVPTNITNIKNDISNLTKEYIRTGLGPDKALEKAATEWAATHERIRNIVVPKTKDLPTNIEELATTAIMHITNTDIPEGAMGGTYASRDAALQAGVIPSADQTLVRYLANNDIDINELSIFPIEGSSQQWMLVDNGLTPLNGEGNKVITFSLEELELIFDADQVRQKEEARQQTNFTIKLENDFALGTGQFEGLTYQQKVTKKEQLEGVPTFTIGPDLPAFFERLKRGRGQEAEEVLAP